MIAGGGTGGHLFPGIAVAECARRRDPDATILFVGAERGIEARVVPQSGFALETLPVAPLRGRGLRERLAALGALWSSITRARAVVARFAPDAVIGLGGYAAAPAVLAALRHAPIVLLEQNARPGLTTRLLAWAAERVCVTFPDTARYFAPGQAIVTGNPVRWRASEDAGPRSRDARAARARGELTILIFGGSAGARRLNDAGPALRAALGDLPGLRLIHQTGAEDEARVRSAYGELGAAADVRAFIVDMGAAYAAADLVICRAGATTVAELAALGLPAILVPYPHAADDHQRANAESLVRAGAARVVLDKEATGERLAAEVRALLAEPETLEEMGRRLKQFARPDAAERVLAVVDEVLRGRAGRRTKGGH